MTAYKLKASDTLANIKQDAKKLVPAKAKSLRYLVGNGKVHTYDHSKNLEVLHGVTASVEFSSVPLANVKKDKALFVPLTLNGYETATPVKAAKSKKDITKKPNVKSAKKKGKKAAIASVEKVKVKKGITADIDKSLEADKYTLREAANHIAAKYPDKQLSSVYQICANRVRVRKLMNMPELHWKSSITGGGFMIYIDELFAKGGKTVKEMVQAVIEKFPKDANNKDREAKRLTGTIRNRATFLRSKGKPVLFNRTEKRYETEYVAPDLLDNPFLVTKAPAKKRRAKLKTNAKSGGKKK